MADSAKTGITRLVGWSGQLTVLQVTWILFFSAATACGAKIEIPDEPVPFTLQTLFVLLSGALLGPVNGSLSQIVYLFAGVLGVPVFAGSFAGPAVLFGPTGGYLLAFPLAAAVIGLMTGKVRTFPVNVLAMSAGLLLVFVSGTLYLYGMYIHDAGAALQSGFLIFSFWDLLKLGAAATIYYELSRRWPRVPHE